MPLHKMKEVHLKEPLRECGVVIFQENVSKTQSAWMSLKDGRILKKWPRDKCHTGSGGITVSNKLL